MNTNNFLGINGIQVKFFDVHSNDGERKLNDFLKSINENIIDIQFQKPDNESSETMVIYKAIN